MLRWTKPIWEASAGMESLVVRLLETKKTPVIGVVEREGRVFAKVAPNAKIKTVEGIVIEHILPESMGFTDEYMVYYGLGKMGFTHRRIQHKSSTYVMDDVHTNTIEGYWSLVKRGIGSVYHSVAQKYLQNYLNEYSFRYNRRKDEQPMFTSFLQQVIKAS